MTLFKFSIHSSGPSLYSCSSPILMLSVPDIVMHHT